MRQTSGASRPKYPRESENEREQRLRREERLWPRAPRVEPLRFRRAPLLAAALAFALGESLTRLPPATTRPTLLLLFAVAALAALTVVALHTPLALAPPVANRILGRPSGGLREAVKRRVNARLAVPAVLALWIATGLWSAQIAPAPSPQTALLAYADGLSRTVEARVVRIRTLPPRATEPQVDSDLDEQDEDGTPTISLDLAVTAIEDVTPDTSRMVPATGGVRATLFADNNPHRNPATETKPQGLKPTDFAGPIGTAKAVPLSETASSATIPPELHCGDLVRLPLRLRAPERYRDPGAWQYADYLLDQGIAATANVSAAKLRVVPNAAAPFSATLRCHIFAAQTWAAARLLAYTHSTSNRRLPPLLRLTLDDAGMLNAMLFGDRTRLSHSLRLGFERTGSFHLFVVSGMHVALLAGLLFWLFCRLSMREYIATPLTLALITAYAALTGFGVPVQRALLMTAVFLIARLLTRQRNSLNALGAAALAVLIFSPRALFEASFQMTFLAIVAIAGIAMPLAERTFLPYAHAARNLRDPWRDTTLPPHLAHFRMMLRLWSQAVAEVNPRLRSLPAALIRVILYAAELALIGIVAEAVMVLPMALTFHRATVFALPANMLSIPLVGILAPLGLATFLASLISPWLAALPGSALALLLHAITGAIQRISHAQISGLPADLRVPGPTIAHALAALACIAFCCWAVRRSRRWAFTALVALPLAAAFALWPSAPAVHPNTLEVTAIDVGQGDSILVVGPTGHAMLIDAGGPTGAAANAENARGLSSDSAFDIGEQVVSPYLWSRQLRRLDVVALTHAHSDHMGGMPAILRNFRPRELWVAVDPDSEPYRALLAEAAALGIKVRHLRAGDTLAFDTVAIHVLAPTPAYTNSGPPINNDSLVLRLQYGQASVLLEGDAEAPSEHAMVVAALSGNSAAALGPDTLLKVGHHGSRTSTTPEFLALAAPIDAVISVGAQNTFGHPRPEIIDRFIVAHTHLYRTDRFGLTTFLLTPDGRIAASNP